MLIWIPEGWEYLAKWGNKEEAEIALLISEKWDEIKEAARYVNKHRNKSKEIRLGKGPNGCEYLVLAFYIKKDQDMLQMIGYAPVKMVAMDVLALIPTLSDKLVGGRTFVAHAYDDHNDKKIRIVGPREGKFVFDRMINAVE